MIYVYKDRIINVEWTVLKGTSTVKENFDRALVKLFLIGPHEKFLLKANAKDGIVSAEVPQGLPEGVYSVEIIYIKNWLGVDRPPKMTDRFPIDCRGNDRCIMRSRKDNLFAITEYESEATEIGEGEVVIRVKTSTASYGYDGLSAYEIAVLRGDFEGTEGEWLEWTHERIVTDVKDLLDKLKSRDTRFVVKTKSQRDNLKDLREGDEVYVIDDGIAYILETENGKRTWKPCDYGTVTSKYILSLIADMPGFVADRAIADEFGKRIVDEYLTRDAVRNYMNEVFNDLFINNPPTIMDGMITVDMLSDAVKQLIGFGPIVNFPDDEFLTTKGGRITPKDRNYDPNNYSGMGRRLLRKNMVNGVNVLTQKMMSCPNTVYVITYDYSLRGQTITVPENCVLQFEGGTITNGVIKLNNTLLIGNPRIHCNIAGTIKNTTIHINWFGVDNTGNIESTNAINNVLLAGHGKIIYFDGTYKINPIASSSKEYDGGIRPISNQILKFTDDSKLIIDGQTAEYYSILSIYKVENVSIYGVNIEGDISNHIGDEGEFGFGIAISSSKNINLYNCKSSYNWGDGYIFLSTGSEESNNFNCNLYNCEAHYNRRQGLSIVALYEGRINNFKATNTGILKYTVPAAGIDIEPDAIRYDERIKVTINNYISENNFGGALHIVPAHLMHDNVTDDHREFYVQVNGLSSNLDGSRNTSVLLPALRYSSVTTNSNLSNKIKGLVELNNITISNSYMNPLEFRNMVDNGLPIIINNLVVLNPKVDSNFAKSMSAVLKFYNPTTYDYTNSAKLTIDNLRIIDTRIDNRVSYLIFSTFGNSPKNIHLFNVENPSMEGGTNIPYFIEEDSEVKYNIPPTYTVSGDNHFLLSNGSNNYWGYRIIFNNPSTKNFRLPKADTVSNFKITVENIQEEHNVHSRFFPGDKINFPLIYTEDPSLDLPPLSSVEFIQKSDKSWDVYKSTDKIIPTLNPYYGNSRNAIKEFSNPMLGHSYYDTDLGVTLSLSETGWVNPDGTSVDKQKFVNHNSQITLPNIIYKIVSDIDLNGATLTLPSGCTLDFQGGSFSNGTIVFNDTIIKSSYKCFKKTIRFSGNLSPQLVKSSWFEFDSVDCIDSLLDIFNISEGCTIHLEEGIYNVSAKYVVDNDFPEGEENGIIKIKSNSKIILDGIVNLLPNSLRHYSIFLIRDKSNVIIEGKGRIIGDVETHTGTTGEWGHGIQISSSKNIVVRDITVSKCWGDGISISSVSTTNLSKDVTIDNIVSTYNRRLGVSIISGDNIRFLNSTTELNGSINGTSPKRGLDIEPDPNSFLNNVLVDNCIIKDQGLCYIPTSGVVSDQDYKIIIQNCNITSQFNICGPCTFKGNRIRFLFITNCRYVEIMNNHIYENLIFAGNSETPVAKTKIIGNNITPLASLAHNAAIVFNDADTTLDEVIFVDNIIDLTKKDEVLLQKGVPGSGTLNIERCSIFGIKTQQQIFWTAGNVLNSLINTNCININHLYNIEDSKVMFAGNTILHTSATPFIIREDINTKYTIEIINNNFIPMSDILLGDLVNYVGHIFAGTIKILGNNFLGNDSSLVGTYSKSPTLTSTQTGRIYYVTDVKIPTFWDGTSWRDANGYPALKKIGTTAERPPISSGSYPGYIYYDTTLKKYICWNGTEWVNMDGTSLS